MTRPGGAPRGPAAEPALTVPGRWAQRALCAQADPDLWYPQRGRRAQVRLAKTICAVCPVRVPCLEYALSGADTWGGIATGIWGGATPRERQRLRQQQQKAGAA